MLCLHLAAQTRVWIDADTANEIDDLYAIARLLAAPLLRPLHLLAAVHADGPADSGWMRPLPEAAGRIRKRRAEWTLYRWSRTSARQQAEIPMNGLLGSLEAEGELDPLLPYLEAGQWLQVGSGGSAGLGAYRLAMAD